MHRNLIASALSAVFAVNQAFAHGEGGHEKSAARPISTEVQEFGREGDPKKASRTVKVEMSDKFRFSPAKLTVAQGQTVKFVVTNGGKLMHEMVLGTLQELKEHAELMKKFPAMEHDEPYMAHVAPGKTESIVWQFTKAGEFYYGCLVAGHFEAGMVGKVTVTPRSEKGIKR